MMSQYEDPRRLDRSLPIRSTCRILVEMGFFVVKAKVMVVTEGTGDWNRTTAPILG